LDNGASVLKVSFEPESLESWIQRLRMLVGRSLCLPDLRIRGAKSRGLLPFLKAQPIRRRGVAVPLRQILLRIEVQQHCQQEKRTDFIEKVSKKLLTAKTVCC
jgi:hypothetical protein